MSKTCSRCKTQKPMSEFHRESRSPDGAARWCKTCMGEVNVRRKATPEYRFSYYRSNARKRGLEFTLTVEDFRYFWNQPCVYCGCLVEGIGLDRIDNTVGYVADNVIPCCARCNAMKSNMDLMEFIERCHRIADRLYLGTDVSFASIARNEA
jgi:hypothetical protein